MCYGENEEETFEDMEDVTNCYVSVITYLIFEGSSSVLYKEFSNIIYILY